MSLKDDILAYVTKHDYVSFAELSRLPGFGSGDFALCVPNMGEAVYWAGLSEEAAHALSDLVREGQVHYWLASSVLIYFIDGCTLKLPLVKQARVYKTPHWLPVTICRGHGSDHPKHGEEWKKRHARLPELKKAIAASASA
jgi:hypothetical protein